MKLVYYKNAKYTPIKYIDFCNKEEFTCYKAELTDSINPLLRGNITLNAASSHIKWRKVTLRPKEWDKSKTIDSLIRTNIDKGLYMLPKIEHEADAAYSKKRLNYVYEVFKKMNSIHNIKSTLLSILQTIPLNKSLAFKTLKKYFNWHSNNVLEEALELFIRANKLNRQKYNLDDFYKFQREKYIYITDKYKVYKYSTGIEKYKTLSDEQLDKIATITNRSYRQTKFLYNLCKNGIEFIILEDILHNQKPLTYNNIGFTAPFHTFNIPLKNNLGCPYVYEANDPLTFKNSIEFILLRYKYIGDIAKEIRINLEAMPMKSVKDKIRIVNEQLEQNKLDFSYNWDILLEMNKEKAVKALQYHHKLNRKTAKSYVDIIWNVFFNGRKPDKKVIKNIKPRYITLAITEKDGTVVYKRSQTNGLRTVDSPTKKVKTPIKRKKQTKVKHTKPRIKYNRVPDKMVCMKKVIEDNIIGEVIKVWRTEVPGYLETGWTYTSKGTYKAFTKMLNKKVYKQHTVPRDFIRDTDPESVTKGKLISIERPNKNQPKKLKKALQLAAQIEALNKKHGK